MRDVPTTEEMTMSRDIYIWWDKDVAPIPAFIVRPSDQPVGLAKDMPGKNDVRKTIENYINGFPCDITTEDAEWTFIIFPSHFTRYGETRQRSIEVHCGDDCVNIITREMDLITNAIADGLGKFIARMYQGRYEAG